ncbi:type ISP restriction/modification enzyme [Nonomuraea sp. LPB2021202275-12-8]|uniref:type ISP restriction/modification enzyme n=1 Tax=Nonomuraea sp. LPB2021202275-12-8 TaxID=3120159 RepID=UPI00300D2E00
MAFIVPSSVIKGAAFRGLRQYLRRTCDLGWIIELTPEGNRPPIATRLLGPDVGRQLSILIFARTAHSAPESPAMVRYLELHGTREEKTTALAHLTTTGSHWHSCGTGWQDSFLPAADPQWAEFSLLGDLMPWRSRGITPGRTWVYAPSAEVLRTRWRTFLAASTEERRDLFREKENRTLQSEVDALPGFPPVPCSLAEEIGPCHEPIQVAYRSFDRQWLIPDNRLLARARPPLWQVRSDHQIYVSEQDAHEIADGPALVFSGLIPDLHHFNGWGGGGVRPLWHDDQGSVPNMTRDMLEHLRIRLGIPVSADDVLAYIAAITAHPEYTRRFRKHLRQPGVRVPLTADSMLWTRAVTIGREILWLHTYGTRYVDPVAGRGHSERALVERFGVRCLAAVRALPERLAEHLDYDPRAQTLTVGSGTFAPVRQEVIDYTVSGRRILWRWLNDRTSQPRNKRRTSSLDDITQASWNRELTLEFLALLSVLTGCVLMHPEQDQVLTDVCRGPLIGQADLAAAGVLPVPESAKKPPKPTRAGTLPLPDS